MLWNKIVDEMVKVEGSLCIFIEVWTLALLINMNRLILNIILSFIIIVYTDSQKSFKNLNYIFKSSQTSKRFAVTSYCDIQQKFFLWSDSMEILFITVQSWLQCSETGFPNDVVNRVDLDNADHLEGDICLISYKYTFIRLLI